MNDLLNGESKFIYNRQRLFPSIRMFLHNCGRSEQPPSNIIYYTLSGLTAGSGGLSWHSDEDETCLAA